VKVTAIYENPTGRHLPKAAMGIVVAYFLPYDAGKVAALKRDRSGGWRRR
jgi:hypothetical protein